MIPHAGEKFIAFLDLVKEVHTNKIHQNDGFKIPMKESKELFSVQINVVLLRSSLRWNCIVFDSAVLFLFSLIRFHDLLTGFAELLLKFDIF